ncbi:MAG: hypothetical protein ORN29_02075 [Rhodoferax sp.]|nr:hypothetical protein [Rhodoferax sp.]
MDASIPKKLKAWQIEGDRFVILRNTSRSFQVFVDGLSRMVSELGFATSPIDLRNTPSCRTSADYR